MANYFVALVALILKCNSQITELGVPRQRYLKDTRWGQLHYVTSLSWDASLPTLLLFHGNPDSLVSYANLIQDPHIKGRYNFLAFDYFGCGSSDDCIPPACVDPDTDDRVAHSFVTIPEFVSVVQEIVQERDVPVASPLVCVGMLKGAQTAIECAHQLGTRVKGVFAVAPVWFTKEGTEMVKKYTIHTRDVKILPSGSQYLDAWFQPSVAPCDYVNATRCAVWTPENLWLNHLKTLNRIRAFKYQWQYILAGLDRNDDLVNQSFIAQIHAPVKYLAWPETAMSMWMADGFQPAKLTAAVNEAWRNATGGNVFIDYVANASEGSIVQNASHYAARIDSLLKGGLALV